MKRTVLALFLAAGLASSSSFSQNLSQSAQSELFLMVQQLQAEVRQLRGDIETQQYKLQKMEREQLEQYRDTDRRLSALILSQAESGAPTDVDPLSVEQATDNSSINPQTTVVETPEIVQPEPEASPQVSDTQAYQTAFALVRERRFDEAITAFESFITTYPQSENLANAYYWVGEVRLAQQMLAPAKEAFLIVVDRFPTHNKRPDALYKLGVVHDRMGDISAKTQTFERLLAEYPSSSAAGLARNYQSR